MEEEVPKIKPERIEIEEKKEEEPQRTYLCFLLQDMICKQDHRVLQVLGKRFNKKFKIQLEI